MEILTVIQRKERGKTGKPLFRFAHRDEGRKPWKDLMREAKGMMEN
jgi:hypothetical protein